MALAGGAAADFEGVEEPGCGAVVVLGAGELEAEELDELGAELGCEDPAVG